MASDWAFKYARSI